MKTFYDVYVRLSTGSGISNLDQVLHGENGFVRLELVDDAPKLTVDKKETKFLNQGLEHIFTEQITTDAVSFNIKGNKARDIFDGFNAKLVDVCYKTTVPNTASIFIKGTKCTIKCEMLANELSKITLSTAIEIEDASSNMSLYQVTAA